MYGRPPRLNHREIEEVEIARIATCLNVEIGNFVVDIINNSSRHGRARRPPAGRPNRHTEWSRCAALQRVFLSRRRGKIIGALNLSESHQHGADRR